jgi:acyl-CoA synthetase (AMP-forming)/AMP-acid ligase II
MHPGIFAAKEPERPAVIMGAAGTVLTYAELEARSNQVAWLARCYGLRPGDGLAVIMENRPEMFDLAWGAQRSGLQFTAVNWLGAYCRSHLAGFKCPRSFEFTVGELRTPVGKIRRGPLREQFGAAPGPYRPRSGGSS